MGKGNNIAEHIAIVQITCDNSNNPAEQISIVQIFKG